MKMSTNNTLNTDGSAPPHHLNRSLTYSFFQEMTSQSFEDKLSLNLFDRREFSGWILGDYNIDGSEMQSLIREKSSMSLKRNQLPSESV